MPLPIDLLNSLGVTIDWEDSPDGVERAPNNYKLTFTPWQLLFIDGRLMGSVRLVVHRGFNVAYEAYGPKGLISSFTFSEPDKARDAVYRSVVEDMEFVIDKINGLHQRHKSAEEEVDQYKTALAETSYVYFQDENVIKMTNSRDVVLSPSERPMLTYALKKIGKTR